MKNEQNEDPLSFFVLASESPRRRELMALLGLPFRVQKAAVDETAQDGESPRETAQRLAQAKARAVATDTPSALVLGCDTVVAFDSEVMGKPAGSDEARAMLSCLRDRPHTVYTALVLVGGGRESVEVAETTVFMRNYTDAEVAAYVASGDPFDKAGAYAIQNAAFDPVASWKGCYANVMGLPLCHLSRMLQDRQLDLTVDLPTACQEHTRQSCTVFPNILSLGHRSSPTFTDSDS
jgi:MAF protein